MVAIKNSKLAFKPDYAVPPGATLAETLAALGMDQAELARRTGLSTKHVSQVINGHASLSPDTAIVLENATGVSARLWINLQANFDEVKARVRARSAAEPA
jgi:HTH-type transcriptional regulator/antitoxin HigA